MTDKRDQYGDIAEEYKDSKQLPFRLYIEEYSLFKMLGDITGLTVADLACGDGFYTRKLKAAGAADVTGVDLSAEMIQLAVDEERNNPLGCKYENKDAAEFETPPLDLVVAMYLLNYAKNAAELEDFCKTAFSILKPGGRFVGFNDNIQNPPKGSESFSQYGFDKECADPPKEGDAIVYKITNEDGTKFEFNNFYLKPETYARAFKQAGFSSFEWKGPYLEPSQKGNPLWEPFMSNPPLIGFVAEKK